MKINLTNVQQSVENQLFLQKKFLEDDIENNESVLKKQNRSGQVAALNYAIKLLDPEKELTNLISTLETSLNIESTKKNMHRSPSHEAHLEGKLMAYKYVLFKYREEKEKAQE
jgi:hypothetical protein